MLKPNLPRSRVSSEAFPDFRDLLDTNDEGTPRPILANAIVALTYAPEFVGVLAFDSFAVRVVNCKPLPWRKSLRAWKDIDDICATEWLQHQGIMVKSHITAEAVQAVAAENSFHPVQEYLGSLVWDETPRLDNWLTTYLGATTTPFLCAVGPRWMISAVARVFQPGCQADHTVLLEGPQGVLKSTALRILAGDWFTDHISGLGSKDSRQELAGKWIIELAELEKLRGARLDRIKSFLTTRVDIYRPSYGRRSEDFPRQCVFAGSVNDSTPFTDETGNRRFWPVGVGTIRIDALSQDRDQLWAEATQRYFMQEPWWLETRELNNLAQVEQDNHYEPGVWDERIEEWLKNPRPMHRNGMRQPFSSSRGRVAITDILVHAIGKPLEYCRQSDRNQVAKCLKRAGYECGQERSGSRRGMRFYYGPK